MSTQLPIAYFNGRQMPLREVHISPLDRGFLFGEGVYEVIPVYAGRPLGLAAHYQRLVQSLAMVGLAAPVAQAEFQILIDELIDANGGGDQSVYLHITRGVAPGVRNHIPHQPDADGLTVFAMCQSLEPRAASVASNGVAAITLPDLRWARSNIKATSLLANTLAREQANAAGAAEAILIRDGWVTEGAASSVLIVANNEVRQPPPDTSILPGTTAALLNPLLEQLEHPIARVAIDEAQLAAADEIWLASSTREVLPVTTLNGAPVGSGRPGPLWQRLDPLYQNLKRPNSMP
ncbi:MAG: aminotransferase class IV [Gammaproteobacteria bacterium]